MPPCALAWGAAEIPAEPLSCAEPSVLVTTAEELAAALQAATAGTTIGLADGTYAGNFVAQAQGSADAPISLCGGRGAVLDGGEIDGGYMAGRSLAIAESILPKTAFRPTPSSTAGVRTTSWSRPVGG